MEPYVLLLLLPVRSLIVNGFDLKLDLDSPSETDRGLCCLLYNAQADCSTSCQGRSCSETCRTSCGVLSSQCGSWTCGNITTACTSSPASLVMVGGNLREDNTEIWSRLVAAAGGQGVS